MFNNHIVVKKTKNQTCVSSSTETVVEMRKITCRHKGWGWTPQGGVHPHCDGLVFTTVGPTIGARCSPYTSTELHTVNRHNDDGHRHWGLWPTERRRWHHGPPGAKPIGTHRIYWIELFNKCLMVNTQLPAPGALTKPWRAAVRPQTGCPVFVCLFGDSAVKQSVWPTSERHRETERDRERKREGERERERERKRETKR